MKVPSAAARKCSSPGAVDGHITETDLSKRRDEFRTRWAEQNVRRPYGSTEHFHHPIVGGMHPEFECTSVSADEVLTLLVFPAVAGSRDADALRLLSAWQATPETSCRN
jgi:hypothetical protein